LSKAYNSLASKILIDFKLGKSKNIALWHNYYRSPSFII